MPTEWLSQLFVAGLATWRLSHLLVEEDGPWDLLYKLRSATGIEYDLAEDNGVVVSYHPSWNPLHCVWCTSLWVAPVMYVAWFVVPAIPSIIALSGIACIVEAWYGKGKH